jgi:hypothetical protein
MAKAVMDAMADEGDFFGRKLAAVAFLANDLLRQHGFIRRWLVRSRLDVQD